MNARIKELEKQLEEVKAEYQEFAYIVSHDFRAPFRQIDGFAKIILNKDIEQFNEKTKDRFMSIAGAAENGQRMLESLLDFSRAKVDRDNFEEVDCNATLEEVKKGLGKKIKSSSASIKSSELPKITGEKEKIYQIFYNLIDNAIKFQAEGNEPKVELSTKKNNGKWEFSIRDNGIGIRDRFQKSIFSPLRKGGTGDDYEGDGTGLAVAKKIVNQHGGDMWLKYSDETGSEFKFTL